MTQQAQNPTLDDIENPLTATEANLKSRLKSLSTDLGFTQATARPSQTHLTGESHTNESTCAASESLDTLQIKIPRYLTHQLAQTAATRRVTKKFLVLEALKQAGYEIHEADLLEDGRRHR